MVSQLALMLNPTKISHTTRKLTPLEANTNNVYKYVYKSVVLLCAGRTVVTLESRVNTLLNLQRRPDAMLISSHLRVTLFVPYSRRTHALWFRYFKNPSAHSYP